MGTAHRLHASLAVDRDRKALLAFLVVVVVVLGLATLFWPEPGTEITRDMFSEESRRTVSEVGPLVRDLK